MSEDGGEPLSPTLPSPKTPRRTPPQSSPPQLVISTPIGKIEVVPGVMSPSYFAQSPRLFYTANLNDAENMHSERNKSPTVSPRGSRESSPAGSRSGSPTVKDRPIGKIDGIDGEERELRASVCFHAKDTRNFYNTLIPEGEEEEYAAVRKAH